MANVLTEMLIIWVNRGDIMKKLILVFFATILMSSFLGIENENASKSLNDWQYQIEITLNPATPEPNFQVRIVLNQTNFDYSKVQMDGDDIRFYSSSEDPLSYWIDTWNPMGTSFIWVKIPQAGTSTISMYFGNLSASSESNSDGIFSVFDDFNDGVWTDKWDLTRSDNEDSYVEESDGTIKIVTKGSEYIDIYEVLESKSTFEAPFIFESKFKYHDGGYSTFIRARSTQPEEVIGEYHCTRYGSDYRAFGLRGEWGYKYQNFDYTTAWKEYRMILYDFGSDGKAELYAGDNLDNLDDILTLDCDVKPSDYSNWKVQLNSDHHNSYGTETIAELDWIRVRKYTENEPVAVVHNQVENVNQDPVIITKFLPDPVEEIQYSIELCGDDPDHDILSWTMETNAEFLQINSETCILSGLPNNDDVGQRWVRINLSDHNGGFDEVNLSFNVKNVNDPPLIISEFPSMIFEDSEVNFKLDAIDIDPTNDELEWSIRTDAVFLTYNSAAGNLTGIPMNNDVGTWWILLNVSDGKGGFDEVNLSFNVKNVNDLPQIISVFPDIIFEDSEVNFKLEAVDIDPSNDILTWSMRTNASFLSLKESEGLVEGKPINDDVGNYSIIFNVSDGNGGNNEVEFKFVVVNTNDPPSLGFPPAIIEMNEDSDYSVEAFSDWYLDEDGDVLDIQYSRPVHLNVSITDQDELLIEPFPDWNGEETISFQASDGEFYLDWNVTIKVLPVNDAPTNLSISIEKTRFRTDEYIIVSSSARDVDLDYGDELTFTWFTKGETSLGKGRTMEFKFEKGEYELVLNVTDKDGEGVETSIFIEVYEETSTFDAYWIVVLIVIVLLILLMIGILIIKNKSRKESDNENEDINPDDHLSIGNANGYSASMVGGGHLSSPELQSFMKQADQLPTAPSSNLDGAPVSQLPPVVNYPEPTIEGSEYVRPQIDISRKGFHTPPSPEGMVSQTSQTDPNSAPEVPTSYFNDGDPPTISSVIDQMFAGNEFSQPGSQESNIAPLKSTSVDPEFKSPIWSPEIVENRVTNDAKSAIELLHELNELRSEGAITEEEFQIHKKRLLRKI